MLNIVSACDKFLDVNNCRTNETENNHRDQHEELVLQRMVTAQVASPTANFDVIAENKTFDDVTMPTLHFNFTISDSDSDVNMFD